MDQVRLTLQALRQIHIPLLPWSEWFNACGIPLTRGKLAADWLDSGRLVRLSPRNVASPFHHFLGWKPGTLARWKCTAFVDWPSAACHAACRTASPRA